MPGPASVIHRAWTAAHTWGSAFLPGRVCLVGRLWSWSPECLGLSFISSVTGCVTPDKLLNLSGSSLFLWNGGSNSLPTKGCC
jgi:hypothetical protein